MEVLYKKLYDKFSQLKAKKFSQLDHVNDEIERRFEEYITAADAYIDQLQDKNQKLQADIDNLRNEVSSLRSAKDQQYEDGQKLLLEERQKNKELAKEIEILQKLQQNNQNHNQEIVDAPQDSPLRKRKRLSEEASDTVSSQVVLSEDTNQQREKRHHSEVSEPLLSLSSEKTCSVDHQQPQFCPGLNDSGPYNALFQVLVECLIGMKVSVIKQSDGIAIFVLHQSSGYSFELTWVKETATEETEFLYRVSSLGTFERVAPEWMKETIIFSTSMCPIFFERVSRVIKHH